VSIKQVLHSFVISVCSYGDIAIGAVLTHAFPQNETWRGSWIALFICRVVRWHALAIFNIHDLLPMLQGPLLPSARVAVVSGDVHVHLCASERCGQGARFDS
jgi:hypothetical protein